MDKNEGVALYKQAWKLAAEGRYFEALPLVDMLLQRFPDESQLLYAKAMCLAKLGRLEESLALCERLEREHNHARAAALKAQLSAADVPSPAPAATTPSRRRVWPMLAVVAMGAAVLLAGAAFMLLRGETSQAPGNAPVAPAVASAQTDAFPSPVPSPSPVAPAVPPAETDVFPSPAPSPSPSPVAPALSPAQTDASNVCDWTVRSASYWMQDFFDRAMPHPTLGNIHIVVGNFIQDAEHENKVALFVDIAFEPASPQDDAVDVWTSALSEDGRLSARGLPDIPKGDYRCFDSDLIALRTPKGDLLPVDRIFTYAALNICLLTNESIGAVGESSSPPDGVEGSVCFNGQRFLSLVRYGKTTRICVIFEVDKSLDPEQCSIAFYQHSITPSKTTASPDTFSVTWHLLIRA